MKRLTIVIHSDVADFSHGGLYVDRDGDVGDVYVDVDEKILFQSFRVKIFGS